ncbi:MAG: monomethylamine:corrinoid methyltransferase [Candidatus Bathyarchaeota archaeon]|nr:monomethylamine:corrinoid methyltransferase [Candidatus Bathyarchaeota archaeon]
MTAPSLWEVLDRACNTGPIMATKEFDMKIFSTASRLVKEYDIRYDPETPVPSDERLADDVWKAGLQLFSEVGTYCLNSSRVIRFEESEIKEGIKELRGEAVIGEGTETRTLKLRDVDDKSPPSIVCGGVIESNMPEGELFIKLYQSIAQEPLIDGFYVGPPLQSSEGKLVRSGTPLETHQGRSMVAWVREATRRAGRPGLHFISACTAAIANVAACDPVDGLRRTDGIVSTIMPELKTDYENLNKIVHSQDYGCIKHVYNGGMIGGWGGGPEGALVVAIANAIMAVMVYKIGIGESYHALGYLRASTPNYSAFVTRPCLWGSSIGGQALSRNTKIINTVVAMTNSGPGTEMQFQEITAAIAAAIPCGREGLSQGTRRFKVRPLLGSGLENRFWGEVGHAMAGVKRDFANMLAEEMVSKYEHRITRDSDGGPPGHTFDEIYDLKTLQPRKKFLQVYENVKKDLRDLGLDI